MGTSLTLVITVSFVFSWTSIYCCSNVGCLSDLLLFLLWLLSLVFFLTSSLLVLFFSFEISVLPLVSLILLFGYQPEELSSTLYLLLYTVIGGYPFSSLSVSICEPPFLVYMVVQLFFIFWFLSLSSLSHLYTSFIRDCLRPTLRLLYWVQ